MSTCLGFVDGSIYQLHKDREIKYVYSTLQYCDHALFVGIIWGQGCWGLGFRHSPLYASHSTFGVFSQLVASQTRACPYITLIHVLGDIRCHYFDF